MLMNTLWKNMFFNLYLQDTKKMFFCLQYSITKIYLRLKRMINYYKLVLNYTFFILISSWYQTYQAEICSMTNHLTLDKLVLLSFTAYKRKVVNMCKIAITEMTTEEV
ncbi:Protein of unknown function [Gryllus bimaculatus]|nr:Protein of unknown function [Gryllus bimaculatus]